MSAPRIALFAVASAGAISAALALAAADKSASDATCVSPAPATTARARIVPGQAAPSPSASARLPAAGGAELTRSVARVPNAFIPPQCYTKTEDERGQVHNPCFTCHQSSLEPNYIDDGDLQLEYSLPAPARTNPWTNLFVDRRPFMASVSDDEILAYVRTSNYATPDGRLILADKLRGPLPDGWDASGDGEWGGYVPDAWFRFDDQGFDVDPTGRRTGWRAFGFYPLPGTFWPTNGSTGDVLVRLPAEFRERDDGTPDDGVYALNLSVVEALVTRRDVAIEPTDEAPLGVDLDGDGQLGRASRVAFRWSVREPSRRTSYVGRARALLEARKIKLAPGLFPLGTEFLHSVRYIDVGERGAAMAARLKELRYARKARWLPYAELREHAMSEIREADAFPDRLMAVRGSGEAGVGTAIGWVLQGFIEDARGELRPQSYEEQVFCVGCHGGVGATVDGIFSFPRKLTSDTPQRGWFHWSQHGLEGLREPRRRDGRYEYTLYLEENGAGDEYRANAEVRQRFFDEQGRLRPAEIEKLHGDVSHLLVPSPERALALDKAYLAVVREQTFWLGRDAVLAPLDTVHREVGEDQPTGVEEPIVGAWVGDWREVR